MLINVTTEKPEHETGDYVQVRVWRSPKDQTTIVGDWSRIIPQPGSATIHVSQIADIEDIWKEALKYAVRENLTWFYVEDEGGLFPAERLGLKRLPETIIHTAE